MAVLRVVPDVTVRDLPAALAAYSAVLGAEVVMDHGWIATLGAPGGAQLSLMTRDATAPVNPAVSVEVDDVEAVHERAIAAGLEIVHGPTDEPWGVRRFFFRDADGAVVNVLQHR